MVPPGFEPARAPAPRVDPDGILLLYAHGSRQEFQRDRCFPNSVTTPRWLRRFAGTRIAGLPVSVYARCTPNRTGEFRHRERAGEPKLAKRARDLEATVSGFVEQGFAPARIFLLGHSAGGWAALRAAHDGDPPIAGVIAFAPAFAGPRHSRSTGWQWLREREADRLAASERLPALVFSYRGDPFETPATLAFLGDIPGLELVELDPARCKGIDPHRAAFSTCVMDPRQRRRVLDFIERRLRAAGAHGAGVLRLRGGRLHGGALSSRSHRADAGA